MAHLPDFEAWVIFAKVSELGSFSHAADELGLASTTVSKAITRLEQRMQTTLFHRTTRKLSLTETGRLSVERAARILADGRAIEADIVEEAAIPRGKVKMSCASAFGIQTMVPIIPAFMEAYPEVELDLCMTEEEVDLIGAGFDLAIRLGPAPDSSLRTAKLISFARPLIASPALVERIGAPRHPDDLIRFPGIIPTNVPWGEQWEFEHATEGTVTVPMRGRYRINHAAAVVPAAVGGVGIALLPYFFVHDELQSGALVELLPEWSASPKSAYMVTPPGMARPARVRVLIDFLRTHYSRQVWAREASAA